MSPSPLTTNRLPSRFWALIPAAGSGTRAMDGAGGDVPKQYRLVAGQPLVWHTLAAFAAVARITHTLVVTAPDDERLQGGGGWTVMPCGGATRAISVLNGLAGLRALRANDHDWVLVHDAARCLITPAQIEQLIAACVQDEVGGLLALPLTDTLKEESLGRSVTTLERGGKWLAQTPQMFRLGALEQALRLAGDSVTDEAGAMEAMGLRPLLVQGSALNFKVTYPEDFALAEAVLETRKKK